MNKQNKVTEADDSDMVTSGEGVWERVKRVKRVSQINGDRRLDSGW